MAVTKTLILEVQVADAQAQIEKLTQEFNDLQKSVDKTNQELESTGDSAKKGSGGLKTMAGGFRAIGTALKAAGIGLVIGLFVKLGDVLSKNQKVVDFFSTAMNSLEIAFTDLFNFVGENFLPAFERVKSFFENLTFEQVGNAIKENLTERFLSLLEVSGFLSDALKKLFTGDFTGALDSVKEAGKELGDVFTGVDDTFDKIGDGIANATNAIGGYIKATVAQGKSITETQNAAEIAAAVQGKIIAQAVKDADELRLIRDDETKTFEERIQASNDLKDVLDAQGAATLAQAQLQLAAAQQQVDLNDNKENTIALIEAETNLIDTQGQVVGLYNEQMAAENGLIRDNNALREEQIAKLKAEADARIKLNAELDENAANRATEQELFEAQFIQNEVDRLAEYKRINDEKNASDTARLLAIIGNDEATFAQKQIAADQIKEIDQTQAQQDIIFLEETANAEIEIEQRVAEAKRQILFSQIDTAVQGFGLLAQVFEKNKAIQAAFLVAESAAGIAKIVINTQAANAAAKLKYALLPGGAALAAAEIAINKVSAGIGIAANIAATAKALSALGGGGGGASVPGGGEGGGAGAPNYSIIGNVQATTGGQVNTTEAVTNTNDTPVKAYVVSTDITTQQSLDRQVENNSSI